MIGERARKLGFPRGGMHAFRRDGATFFAAANDDLTARDILGPNQQGNTLHNNYSGGVSMVVNLTGQRGEEDLTMQQQDKLRSSRYSREAIHGPATRGLALQAGEASTAPSFMVDAIPQTAGHKRTPTSKDVVRAVGLSSANSQLVADWDAAAKRLQRGVRHLRSSRTVHQWLDHDSLQPRGRKVRMSG